MQALFDHDIFTGYEEPKILYPFKQDIKPLTRKIAIYVPSTYGESTLPEDYHNHFRDQTAKALSQLFGGATSIKSEGLWANDKGHLIRESVYIVYAYTDDINDYQDEEIYWLAIWLKETLLQDCIGVEIDTNFYLV